MEIVRKLLSASEITPPNIRYNPECDCVEQTWDGGATWTPTPGADPRTSPAFRAPARTGDQPQCNAAANMAAQLRNMVDADISATNKASLATLLLGTALLFVPVAGWIADAFLLVADAIILLDQVTIEAAFTETVYSDLVCTFFCNIDADGQMSDDQLTQFLSDVSDNYAFVVYRVISEHSDSLGAVGWSNMGALGSGTGGDCSACACIECDEALNGHGENGWTPLLDFDYVNDCVTTYDSGADQFINSEPCATSYFFCACQRTTDFAVSSIKVHVVGTATGSDSFGLYVWLDGVVQYSTVFGSSLIDDDFEIPFGSPIAPGALYIRANFANSGGGDVGVGSLAITAIELCPA